jgi:hypothetical protein
LKNKSHPAGKLSRFHSILGMAVLAALLIPFILQQTVYPFFRFGMFAEPVKSEIQSEYFRLIGKNSKSVKGVAVSPLTGIKSSTMDYLLRNYYYRGEAEVFLQKIPATLPENVSFDTLLLVRHLGVDSSIVARYPPW